LAALIRFSGAQFLGHHGLQLAASIFKRSALRVTLDSTSAPTVLQ
jgi:hypothetical protein